MIHRQGFAVVRLPADQLASLPSLYSEWEATRQNPQLANLASVPLQEENLDLPQDFVEKALVLEATLARVARSCVRQLDEGLPRAKRSPTVWQLSRAYAGLESTLDLCAATNDGGTAARDRSGIRVDTVKCEGRKSFSPFQEVGLLQILACGSAGNLLFETRSGSSSTQVWSDVESKMNSATDVIVIGGLQLSAATGYYYHAPQHASVSAADVTRTVMPYSLRARPDVQLQPGLAARELLHLQEYQTARQIGSPNLTPANGVGRGHDAQIQNNVAEGSHTDTQLNVAKHAVPSVDPLDTDTEKKERHRRLDEELDSTRQELEALKCEYGTL